MLSSLAVRPPTPAAAIPATAAPPPTPGAPALAPTPTPADAPQSAAADVIRHPKTIAGHTVQDVSLPASAPGLVLREPFHVTKLRDLTLEKHPEAGRPNHVSAASGMVRKGEILHVVSDDENFLGSFTANPATHGKTQAIFPGALPLDPKQRKKVKPDFESLTALPPRGPYEHGALVGVGSGSTKTAADTSRSRGFVWGLDAAGNTAGEPRELNFAPLFDLLRPSVAGQLNIEGIAVNDKNVVLFNRGNSTNGENLAIHLSLDRFMQGIGSQNSIGGDTIEKIVRYDLGNIDGVKLDFADAQALPDGRIAFAASAERTDDAIGDGPVAGSVVGTIAADGQLQSMHQLRERLKLEGLDAHIYGDRINLLLTSDADDPKVPSPLMAGSIPATFAPTPPAN